MKNLIAAAVVLATLFFAVPQAMAACVEGPANTFTCNTDNPNPDLSGVQESGNHNNIIVNLLPGAGIDTTAIETEAIELGRGNNQVTLNGAKVRSEGDNGIQTGGGGTGENTVTVTESEIICYSDCIDILGDGNATVNVSKSRVESLDNDSINTGRGNDIVTVEDSVVLAGPACCNNIGISTGDGNDEVTITNSRVAGFRDVDPPWAIILGDDDDTLTLGTGARIDGLIRCDGGTDTINFAMAVPPASLAALGTELAGKNPAGDSIVINGYTYVWENCEELSNQLSALNSSETRATFLVSKSFSDGLNPTEVNVTISCNTGLILDQTKTISEIESVEFVVTSFNTGELDCEITEQAVDGYTATYEPFGPGAYDNKGGCNFQDIENGADHLCRIVNDADFVDVEIEKVWVIDGSGGDDVDTRYVLTLFCDAMIADGDENCQGSGGPGYSQAGLNGNYPYCKQFYGDDSDVFVAEVQPQYPGSQCYVTEHVYDNSVEIDNDCGNLEISAGTGDSCVITNSVFFEGVPTLSHYGMAIMALLMLGLGVMGFRRYS